MELEYVTGFSVFDSILLEGAPRDEDDTAHFRTFDSALYGHENRTGQPCLIGEYMTRHMVALDRDTRDHNTGLIVTEYHKGTAAVPQPMEQAALR